MSGPRGWWRAKSRPEQVETYTRWSFYFFAVVEIVGVGLPAVGHVPSWLAGWLVTAVAVHAVVTTATSSLALDWTRGRRARPVRALWVLAAFTVLLTVAVLAVHRYGAVGRGTGASVGTVAGGLMSWGGGMLTLGVRSRRRMLAIITGFAAGAGLAPLPLGVPWPVALVGAFLVFLCAGFLAVTCLFSVWLLDSVYELDEARETRARLAVAEERLRFGRDLHDVLGRNLSVISLKSELAVQLARRGRPEAVGQMVEVQRIAQESQREVRAVVRGYREADLGVELAGAQGVLTAAGIDCEVGAQTAGLPAEVQSVLGWVVREATTNVLRHGDPGHCSLRLQVLEGRVVLTVENDGVAGTPDGGGGSGLAGLRERLAVVGGTLQAGRVGADRFRLTAEVPLTQETKEVSGVTL
ncbi:sensor histidine kinase [Streptomyces sp. MMG1121]|uniref:sensor histidine kinase n=1 Tax=Streptomyces sp. MMG1121 TaxID=1415544 RepID=UPI0006BEBB0F|nr:histidine kinase [Streptomyces sp. MMG1121]KOV61421.1 histidine kinase [Streptomyces sp. MMG1121]